MGAWPPGIHDDVKQKIDEFIAMDLTLAVQDENGNISTTVTQIDFQGAGVSVTPGSGEVVVTIPGGTGITSITYANMAKGQRTTLLYNGSTGFVDPYTGAVATSRPSSRPDIYFDCIGGDSSVADPTWFLEGDAREILY